MTDAEREAQIRHELLTEHYFPDCHCDRCALLRLLDEARTEIARLQAPPGASAMERAAAACRSQHAVPPSIIPQVARAIERAEREARAAALEEAASLAEMPHRMQPLRPREFTLLADCIRALAADPTDS